MSHTDESQSDASRSHSTDEESLSDEEAMDVVEQEEDESESNRSKANDLIATILEESEKLEQDEASSRKKNGKQKLSKDEAIKQNFWKLISDMQSEISSLKRSRQESDTEASKKKARIDTSNSTAYERPCSSGYQKPKTTKQLSSASKKMTQPSSASNTQQLKPANQTRLSAEQTPQLSTVQRSRGPVTDDSGRRNAEPNVNVDDVITIQAGENDDPLAQEIEDNETQENDLSEDIELSSEDKVDNVFDDMVDAIDIQGEDDLPGEPLPEAWAEKVNLAWKTKVAKGVFNALLQKYKTPSNLNEFKVPKMNSEIWRLIGKWQRKADLTLSGSQRALMKAATAVLKLHDYFTSSTMPRSTRQIAMQTVADITTLLGKVNRDITLKRKTMIRPSLKGDFKTLSTSTDVTENLFGDNLTQAIKDIQVKRKIEDPSSYSTSSGYQNRRGHRGTNNTRYYNNNYTGNFLWRGRGRGRYQHRASRHQNQ